MIYLVCKTMDIARYKQRIINEMNLPCEVKAISINQRGLVGLIVTDVILDESIVGTIMSVKQGQSLETLREAKGKVKKSPESIAVAKWMGEKIRKVIIKKERTLQLRNVLFFC